MFVNAFNTPIKQYNLKTNFVNFENLLIKQAFKLLNKSEHTLFKIVMLQIVILLMLVKRIWF